ncbi:protein RST1-like isoform X2 [Chenopodium quinoa]|uniref:protein RST1-like isoform X2 n=1 Tax=Chenopodium quinoa TaxID=63459 RepID=UPI000B7742CC|nr:protein RST1-like isoform X2 [Chenopodium quinoa]
MEAYAPLLVRTRVPQPSLQRYAVIQIFEKLRSTPSIVNPNSDPEREAITQCLQSSSLAVVDQSVRELCRLVKDSKLDHSFALLELQSALEGCPPRFVNVFVKGIGFLVRFGFRTRGFVSENFVHAPENHPFVKVLTCRSESQNELVQQVVLFVVHGKQNGIGEVCDYLRPLLTFSVVVSCSSDSSLSSFLSLVIYSLMSLCCSLLHEASPLLEMLIDCLRCFSLRGAEDIGKVVIFAELLVDAHGVVLQHLVKIGSMVTEAQLIGVKLLDALLTLCLEFETRSIESKPVLELSRRLLSFQKELKLHYLPQLFSPMLSLFVLLAQLELEDEKLYVLDLLAYILKWRIHDENVMAGAVCNPWEVSLFSFPIISLMSSPSNTVKQAASQFLLMLEKLLVSRSTSLKDELSIQRESLFVSKLEMTIFRLLRHLWLQDLPPCSFFLNIYSAYGNRIYENGSKSWLSHLGKYALSIAERHKSSDLISSSHEVVSTEVPFVLGALAGSLVVNQSLGSSAIETLAALSNMEPKLGVSLLLAVLYYCNLIRSNIKECNEWLLKLLTMLSVLASNSSMLPLIFQTILPMLQKDSNPVLYATALRLLCKAWEINDRVFGSLRSFLLPECFVEFRFDETISISMAASLRDVCRRNPERGVQLILSVAACIESSGSIIRALGFQSIGYLCEADVVDFYTAWNVIAKYGLEYSTDPVLAYSLCSFLRWGAMDAEAYAEASVTILQILWDIGSSNCYNVNPLWIKARVTAIKALSCFEVLHFDRSIPDFRDKAKELLIHETDIHVLQVIKELETKIIAYEHSTRQRFVKKSRAPRSKIEKLLEVFPRVICSSEKSYAARMIPGTALFQLQSSQKDANYEKSEIADDVFAKYHNMLKEVAASLTLSRNIFIALLSLQSWKSFMQNWLHKYTSVLVVKASTSPLDKISKAANNILKCMIKVAEDSMPRVAENIALAVGAFCMYEHEHRQWSAAISIGVISTCLHSTDRQQKFQCVNGLIEVVCESRNILVKGACGIGLGYSCQDLLTRDVTADNALDQASFVLQEKALLGKIVRTLSLRVWKLTQISSDLLVSLSKYKAPGLEDDDTKATSPLMVKRDEDVGDDLWGVTGLVMGLGMSISALSRAGSYDAMCSIKILLTSWIAQADFILTESTTGCQSSDMLLTTGACLVLPIVASVCRRLEKMHDNELSDLLFCYENLISKIQMEKTCNILHHNQLMAACVGAGSLISFILDEGLVLLDVHQVKNLLGEFKKIYSDTYPHLVHLGAFLGVVNAMGADTGSKTDHRSPEIVPVTFSEGRESSRINAPLLSSSCFAEELLALIQDIFLVAQDSSDSQLQAYASWAMSFLHQHLCSEEDKDENISSLPNNQSFSKDATVMQLSTWLMQLDYSKDTPHVNTVAAVLRCLSSAPRLPKLDWGAVIRRCMKYEAHISEFLPQDTSSVKSSLRKECVLFSLAHANKIDPLLSFLDELTSLFRFRTLDLITQSCLLFHLLNLTRIFSSSRTKMLLEDISEFLSSLFSSYRNYNVKQKRFLLLACWKGLSNCFDEDSLDTSEYLSGMEKCMEILFASLPAQPTAFSELELMPTLEWNEAIVCLGKARKAWLLDLLQVSTVTLVSRDDYFGAMLKKMLAITQLVKLGSLPLTELAKLKSYMLNAPSQGMWKLFVEITAVIQAAEGSIKRQWVISVLEISCITKYPSTALQFLGLISGCFCKYMPLLVLDPQAVLVDLPVTLSSLLSSIKWGGVADAAVSCLWTLTVRIYSWAKTFTCIDESLNLDIDPSEAEMSNLLMQVLLDACHNLKEFLPLKNQLMLANMVMC